MRIAIPTEGNKGLQDTVSKHFGMCKTYTVLDENGNFIETIENTSSHFGGEKLPPELMNDHDINVLLCFGIGARALRLCKNFNIEVFIGYEMNVLEIFNKWKQGELVLADMMNACKETH